MVIPSGMLKHPDGILSVMKHTTAHTAGGGWSDSTATLTTRNASIAPLTPEEILEAKQVGEQVTHKITVRYDSVTKTVTGKDHYLVLGSRIFEIVGSPMDTDERHRQLTLKCRERR